MYVHPMLVTQAAPFVRRHVIGRQCQHFYPSLRELLMEAAHLACMLLNISEMPSKHFPGAERRAP